VESFLFSLLLGDGLRTLAPGLFDDRGTPRYIDTSERANRAKRVILGVSSVIEHLAESCSAGKLHS
jgi:hypothetical protein